MNSTKIHGPCQRGLTLTHPQTYMNVKRLLTLHRCRHYAPVLKSACKVEINAIIESSAAEKFLQRQARMFQDRIPMPMAVSMIETVFRNALCRVRVDLVI